MKLAYFKSDKNEGFLLEKASIKVKEASKEKGMELNAIRLLVYRYHF